MIEHILFDFDGTLADTEDIALKVANFLADKHGFKRIDDHELHEYKKLHFSDVIRRLRVPPLKVLPAFQEGLILAHEEISNARIFPGIGETLEALSKDYKLAILSSNSEETIRNCLKKNDVLQYFGNIMSEFYFLNKGFRIKRYLHENKIGHTRCNIAWFNPRLAYVGDEIRDIHAAHSAKVPIISVDWGYNHQESLEQGMKRSNRDKWKYRHKVEYKPGMGIVRQLYHKIEYALERITQINYSLRGEVISNPAQIREVLERINREYKV